METATAFWKLDELIGTVLQQIVDTGKQPHEIIDEMMPIRLRPEDQHLVLREGLLAIVNGSRGMRGFRSGKVQTASAGLRSLPEESEGLAEFADRLLARLVFSAADGSMRSVLDFTPDDVAVALDRRVRAAREMADREEPFWVALQRVVKEGKTLRQQTVARRRSIAKLAVTARLAAEEETE